MKLYHELASWFHLLTPPDDYAEEAQFYYRVLRQAGLPEAATLLELGSGGGNNAFHLKRHFGRVTLSDLSPAMLALSQTINPECEHVLGDMRQLRLGRVFDAVFIHDAIGYLTNRYELSQALETAAVHCRAGGLALIAPDWVKETYQPETDHGGEDGRGRSLRYLEWSYDPDPQDSSYEMEMVYLLRQGDAPARVVHERHTLGLFSRQEWLTSLQQTGFSTQIVQDAQGRDMFLSRK